VDIVTARNKQRAEIALRPFPYSYPKICEPGVPTFLPDLIEAGGDKPPGAGS